MTPAVKVVSGPELARIVKRRVEERPALQVHVSDGETGEVLDILATPTAHTWSPTPAPRTGTPPALVFQIPRPVPGVEDLDDEDGDDA